MLPSEILAQVRRIEIRTGKLVTETLAGDYLSAFKGQGMAFAEVREYVPGDDVRSIDWNVTARLSRPFVKRFTEERELTVMLALDLSGSQFFGTGRQKRQLAAELAALLAFSALQNRDKVGLAIFTDGIELMIPPARGRRHCLRIVREALGFEPASRRTAIGASLDTLNRVVRRRAILFVISDFQDAGFEAALRRSARKHDLVPVLVGDPRERSLDPLAGFVEVEDPETGESAWLPAAASSFRADYAGGRAKKREALEKLFRTCGLEPLRLRTDESYAQSVVRFFRERARRLRRQ